MKNLSYHIGAFPIDQRQILSSTNWKHCPLALPAKIRFGVITRTNESSPPENTFLSCDTTLELLKNTLNPFLGYLIATLKRIACKNGEYSTTPFQPCGRPRCLSLWEGQRDFVEETAISADLPKDFFTLMVFRRRVISNKGREDNMFKSRLLRTFVLYFSTEQTQTTVGRSAPYFTFASLACAFIWVTWSRSGLSSSLAGSTLWLL